MSYYIHIQVCPTICLKVSTCQCVWRVGTGRGWGHVHVCVEGDQGGDGDMYMCVWRGTREDIGTCTCVCGGGPGRGWGNVHVCVEGGQGGDRDMYMCVWRGARKEMETCISATEHIQVCPTICLKVSTCQCV